MAGVGLEQRWIKTLRVQAGAVGMEGRGEDLGVDLLAWEQEVTTATPSGQASWGVTGAQKA